MKLTLILLLVLTITSCKKFLEVKSPTSSIPIDVVFENDNNANSAVAGMYLSMYEEFFQGGGIPSLSWVTGLTADEFHNNPQSDLSIQQLEQNDITPDNRFMSAIWARLYNPIYQANAIMEGLERSSGVSSTKKEQFKGEALFVRAFCHFYLVNLFGDIPLVLTTNYQTNGLLPRTAREVVYEQIVSDLIAAQSLLPQEYTTTGRVRPTRSAADALIARVYLYRHNWSKAEENASKIISQSVPSFVLSADLNTVFLATSTEAIWQLKPGDLNSYTNEGYSFLTFPSNSNVLTDTLVKSFSNIDKRKLNWITNSGALRLPFKYKLYQFSTTPSNEYPTVFRLAEQYLIRAEARTELGNLTGTNSALSDINMVRNRAGLTDTTASTKAELMSIIERERKLELFGEWGHRWLDLKRWSKSNDVLSTSKPNWQPTDTLYPLPLIEMNKNPNLKPQNPGY